MRRRDQRRERTLAGRVAIVTGGARGTGLATARVLASRGARLAIAALDGELARTEASDLPGAAAFEVDVSDRDSLAALLSDTAARLGPVDVLVNNAAVMHLGRSSRPTSRPSAARSR